MVFLVIAKEGSAVRLEFDPCAEEVLIELDHGPDVHRLRAEDDVCELLGAKNFGKVLR